MASNNKVLTIDITNESITITEVTASEKKTSTVHNAIIFETPEDAYEDGFIRDKERIAEAIKSQLAANGITNKNAIFVLTSTKIVNREVLVPFVKENKIKGIINANSSEYFPVNMDEYIIQYTVLEKVEDQGQEKIKLMVAAVPSEVVESYYGLAKALGLKVAFVDYAGNSTYQIMKQQIGPEVSLVIQVENDGTVINIFKDNVLQLQRNVPYGKSMLVNAVMEKYGLKYEAATTKLQNETLLHSRFDGDEVTESLRYMASNINRVIDYYVSRNRLSIQKAYLIGHSTSIKGFATLLSNELNMPIEKVERLKNIALDKKAYVEEATLTSYVTNLGAVIDPVDFIPKRLIESGARKENTKTLIVGFVGALVVSALLVLIPLVQVVALNAEIGSLNKSIKKLSIINDVVNEYYSAKDKYNDIAAFAALTSDSDDALQDFVDYLEKSMPSDITIQSFNVASGAITVNGTAGSKSSVAKFIQELQKNSSVLNVDAPTITETKDNAGTIEVTFSLSCTFVGGTSNTTDMKSSNTSNSTKNSSTKSSTTK